MVFTCFPANVTGEFFEVKQLWAPFLPKFSGILFGFSGILPKFSRICPNFQEFAQILGDFAQIFNKSNFLGVHLHPLHPCLLHHWCTLSTLLSFFHLLSVRYASRWKRHKPHTTSGSSHDALVKKSVSFPFINPMLSSAFTLYP